ncbi:MAG TPA: hypothetical protein VGG16_14205 [Streptosporangiaceae bacterium]|jgi:hypothetical protein
MNRYGTARLVAVVAFLGAVCAGAAGCGSQSSGSFVVGGSAGGSSATAAGQPDATVTARPSLAAGSTTVTMPPFGSNVHVAMTSYLPGDPQLNVAVTVDKDYQLDYLYAEYTGGRSQSWMNEVSTSMVSTLQNDLAQPDVTAESFKGTIRFFDMFVIPDPTIKGNVDVSSCVDTAGSLNTSIKSGAVLPGQSVTNQDYYRYTDELAPITGGGWQIVQDYPDAYYPQVRQCKP